MGLKYYHYLTACLYTTVAVYCVVSQQLILFIHTLYSTALKIP